MNVADLLSPSEVLARHWRRPFERWMDGVEAGWAIPLLLTGFIAVWLGFLAIAYFNADLHPDTLQAWSSGRSLQWGYARNPPLAAWLAHAWTLVFPLTNWSFRLLALTHAAFALWAVDLIARRFVWGDKRIVLLLLLLLLPVYQFLAQPFRADTVLLAAWPIATYCFMRSFETRQIRWAAAAGVTVALAILGKYYSVFLIMSFIAAAICHPQRRAYFASMAPLVSTFAGLAVLSPHLYWLATTGSRTFGDALAQLTSKATAPSLIETFAFMLILALVLAVPVLKWSRISAERFKQLAEEVGAIAPSYLLLCMVGVGFIVFPIVIAVALGRDLIPALGLQSTFLFAILIVCGGPYPIPRYRSVNLAVLATALAMVFVLAVAPLQALYRDFNPFANGRNFYQSSAAELTRQWHARFDQPLSAVGGEEGLALAVAFYSPDHPVVDERLVLPNAHKLRPETRFEGGGASLCVEADAPCEAAMQGVAAKVTGVVRSEFTVESKLPDLAAAQQHFTAFIVPPSAAAPAIDAPPAIAVAPAVTAPSAPSPAVEAAAPAAVAAVPAIAAPLSPSMAAADAVAAEDQTQVPPPSARSATPTTVGAAHDAKREAPPTPCCAAALAQARAPHQPEVDRPAVAPAGAGDEKSIRRTAAPEARSKVAAAAGLHLNLMRRAAARRAAAGCSVRAVNARSNPCCGRCRYAARLSAFRVAVAAGRGSDVGALHSICSRDSGDPALRRPVLAQLAQPLCALAGALGARPHVSDAIIPANAPPSRDRASAAEPLLLGENQPASVVETAESVVENENAERIGVE